MTEQPNWTEPFIRHLYSNLASWSIHSSAHLNNYFISSLFSNLQDHFSLADDLVSYFSENTDDIFKRNFSSSYHHICFYISLSFLMIKMNDPSSSPTPSLVSRVHLLLTCSKRSLLPLFHDHSLLLLLLADTHTIFKKILSILFFSYCPIFLFQTAQNLIFCPEFYSAFNLVHTTFAFTT